MIRCIVAGSRTFDDYKYLSDTLDRYFSKCDYNSIEIITGDAQGADSLGNKYAKDNSLPLIRFTPAWDRFGKCAGFIRNRAMAEYATHCVVFIVNNSKGSASMIQLAKEYQLVLRVKWIEHQS